MSLLITPGQWRELVLFWVKQFAVTRLMTLPQGDLWDSPLRVWPGEPFTAENSVTS